MCKEVEEKLSSYEEVQNLRTQQLFHMLIHMMRANPTRDRRNVSKVPPADPNILVDVYAKPHIFPVSVDRFVSPLHLFLFIFEENITYEGGPVSHLLLDLEQILVVRV